MKNAPVKKPKHEPVSVGDLIRLKSTAWTPASPRHNPRSIRGSRNTLGLVVAVRRWQIDFSTFDTSTRGTIEVLWSNGACETIVEGDWAVIVKRGNVRNE